MRLLATLAMYVVATCRMDLLSWGVIGHHGYIAQWSERLTADQQVPGSNPGAPFTYARNISRRRRIRRAKGIISAWIFRLRLDFVTGAGSCVSSELVSRPCCSVVFMSMQSRPPQQLSCVWRAYLDMCLVFRVRFGCVLSFSVRTTGPRRGSPWLSCVSGFGRACITCA